VYPPVTSALTSGVPDVFHHGLGKCGEGEGFDTGGSCKYKNIASENVESPLRNSTPHHANTRKRFSICASQIPPVLLCFAYAEHMRKCRNWDWPLWRSPHITKFVKEGKR